MSQNKAAHYGSCQCCGSHQKLPGGVLAKHGYTVAWGFFSGTCRGSGHLPFQKSCDQIKVYIAEAQRDIQLLRNEQTKLLQPVTEPKAWVRESSYIRHHRVQTWVEVILNVTFTMHGDLRWPNYSYVKSDGKTESLDPCIRGASLQVSGEGIDRNDILQVCRWFNSRKAESLNGRIAQLQRYIEWQQTRVENWKPGKLIPVEKAAEPFPVGTKLQSKIDKDRTSEAVVVEDDGLKSPLAYFTNSGGTRIFVRVDRKTLATRAIPWRQQDQYRRRYPAVTA